MTSLPKICWRYVGIIISIVLIGACICPAYGQNDPYTLEPITVTAEKRSEQIQKVPAAITAFSETELEDAGAKSILDVIDMIPGLNLEVQAPMWNGISYRGIGKSTFTGKNPVVLFVDGIPLDSRTDYDSDLLNIQRVEFLRGPQGTLYGKSAIGGVINIISKKPDNTPTSTISGKWGENGTHGFKAVVNGPLIQDKLFASLSASYDETDGFMTNDAPTQDTFDDERRKSAKAQLRWLLSDGLEINFRGGIDQSRNGVGPSITANEVCYHETKNPDNKSDADGFDSALNIRYSTRFAEFNAITTYRDTETDFWEGAIDPASARVADLAAHSFTQELRMQSPEKDTGIKWVTGLYYAKESSWAREFGNSYNMESSLGYNIKKDWPYDLDERTMALFGQTTVPLFRSVDFTAGLRYEKIDKTLDYTGTVTRLDTHEQLSKVTWSREEEWDALLPKGVLSWNIDSEAMLYFSVAKGYLAGGLNKTNDDIAAAKFDEETSLNYEIGAKTAWVDNRLFLNATLFYVDIEDMHVYSQPEPGVWVASNAAKAHSQGLEVEAKARPFPGMDLAGSFAWIDAQFDDYGRYDGNTPTYTPDYSYFLSAQYRHASGIYIRGEMTGYGKTYYDAGNSVKRDPLEVFNAKLGYETANWDLYLYADNLTDKAYFTEMSATSGSMVGAPRTLGLMASIRF